MQKKKEEKKKKKNEEKPVGAFLFGDSKRGVPEGGHKCDTLLLQPHGAYLSSFSFCAVVNHACLALARKTRQGMNIDR